MSLLPLAVVRLKSPLHLRVFYTGVVEKSLMVGNTRGAVKDAWRRRRLVRLARPLLLNFFNGLKR